MIYTLRNVPYLDLDEDSLESITFQSGCLSLYGRRFFPWGGLPYPKWHAEVGCALADLPDFKETALKMGAFQEATLDHEKKPIFSFLRQEQSYSYEELFQANRRFFDKLKISPKNRHAFHEPNLGIVTTRDLEKTVAIFGCGCKSGLGAFLYKDVGVLNFGPEMLPLGDAARFGIAGRPLFFEHSWQEEGFTSSFCSRVSIPHPRNTEIFGLSDAGYSGLWIKAKLAFLKNRLMVEAEFEGTSTSELAFSFFCKAQNCIVAKSHKLKPKSLDRYMGPPDEVELRKEASFFIRSIHGFSKMEIIPLAGDEGFWGADFLVAFFVDSPKVALELFF